MVQHDPFGNTSGSRGKAEGEHVFGSGFLELAEVLLTSLSHILIVQDGVAFESQLIQNFFGEVFDSDQSFEIVQVVDCEQALGSSLGYKQTVHLGVFQNGLETFDV